MTRPISPFSIVYSLLAGPILWFVHFMAVYVLAEFSCRANFRNLIFFSPESIRLWITVLTLLLLIPVAAGGALAYRNWRTFPGDGGNDGSPLDARLNFLVVAGLLLSVIFLVSIIGTVIPTYFVGVCDQAA
jgi:hypothetical protein